MEVTCLAANIYAEARGESRKGQLAVAQVTLNRVKSSKWPNSICKTVFQKKQFSWTNITKRLTYDEKSMNIAYEAIYMQHELSNFEATHYHTDAVKPGWRLRLEKLGKIGAHIFYK